MTVHVGLRIASALLWFNGVGFGVFTLPAMRNLLLGREIPIVMGFKAYGGGPFERDGVPTTVWLLAAFLLVCVAECVAGWLQWAARAVRYSRWPPFPSPACCWWGFAPPVGPLLAILEIALTVLNWRSLR